MRAKDAFYTLPILIVFFILYSTVGLNNTLFFLLGWIVLLSCRLLFHRVHVLKWITRMTQKYYEPHCPKCGKLMALYQVEPDQEYESDESIDEVIVCQDCGIHADLLKSPNEWWIEAIDD